MYIHNIMYMIAKCQDGKAGFEMNHGMRMLEAPHELQLQLFRAPLALSAPGSTESFPREPTLNVHREPPVS